MPDTDKSVSTLATNGHVLDKSKTNPLEWQVQTRICPYLACLRHVLDKSARWSLGITQLCRLARQCALRRADRQPIQDIANVVDCYIWGRPDML